ncbi:MAG TPA: ABC transporter permease [Agriterribacter sp.]|nr:ABC transporter permease [Agriterribacter sp.]
MLRNYFKIAYRNLVKNKIYSLVNIFGLAIGMAACFFVFQYVNFESGYDRFNTNAANIYRVPISYSGSFSNVPMTAANHPAVGPAMKKDFPEVLDYTRLVNISLFMNASTISYKGDNPAPVTYNEGNIYLADSSFFNIFSYPLITGKSKTCLAEPKTVVISESSAKKYFGKKNPMGQTLTLNGDLPLKVTAVFRDVPENSHIKFDMLISFSTTGPEWGNDNWRWPEFYNYVLLAPGTDVKKLEAKFPAFIDKYLGTVMKELNFRSYFHLQPLTDIHLKSNLLKEAEANGSEKEVYFLSIIGVFILLIAWINYINLSTAKSMERAKEVGIRKVSGAIKGQLIVQFLLESFIINILALLVAFLIIATCMPLFNHFIGKNINAGFFTSGLGANPLFWLTTILVFITGALLVGAYPAFVLSSFKPVKVLKGFAVISNSGISLRRVLVAFQFMLSIALIAATIIVFNQLNFMRNGNLGYKNDQVLVIKSPAIFDSTIVSRYDFFKSELLKMPSVINATSTSDIPGSMIRYRNSVRRSDQDKQSNFTTYLVEIDQHFVKTYNIEMLAGKNFGLSDSSRIEPNSNTKVLINEEIVKAMGYKSPEEAINQEITFTLGQDDIRCRVLGVMKNYHQRSLKEKYDPILYYFPSWAGWKYVSVNISVTDLNKNLAGIERMYKNAFPGNPFEYFFLDEYFNRQYQADQRLGNVFGLFAVLAILVACLGLLGLSSFVIKLRTKEIGIRKVLGASVSGILVLISKDFVKLVCIASVIAVPVTWWVAKEWLNNYAFHINLSLFIFLIPPLLLLAIALTTICLQSLKTALTNPVKSLRTE